MAALIPPPGTPEHPGSPPVNVDGAELKMESALVINRQVASIPRILEMDADRRGLKWRWPMKNWWALAGIVLAAGCQSSYPVASPFGPYGMRVVPPPATGTVGVPSGYPAPPAYQPPPMGNGAARPCPVSRRRLQPPRDRGDVGNWESAHNPNGADFGLAPPIMPRNPYANAETPLHAGLPPYREAQQLSWQPPRTSPSQPMYGSGGAPYYPAGAPSQIADQPPQFAGPPPSYSVADTVYIPPVRPSIVRPPGHAVVTYDSAIPGAGCCDPVTDAASMLAPIPSAEPATYTSRVDDRWEPRRLR